MNKHDFLEIGTLFLRKSYLFSPKNSSKYNRPPSKLAYAEGFEGDTERRTAAYSSVREDSSTGSTYKSPAEVEFRRRSN